MPRIPAQFNAQQLATIDQELTPVLQIVTAQYDFAVDGGAISTIALSGGLLPIPAGAIIVGGYVDVTTALTSGGAATIAMQVEAANDILTAVAVATWSLGRKNILPALTTGALTASTYVKPTVARDISIVIAAAALTAGAFRVGLFYVDPQYSANT
jgi:hypothetical protein